ncbi:MAG: hypothetical protein QOJ82_2615 [Solirubrobacteraceae bacterium]|nr:hypothetical protein [Solirubrobacteraceae bacterium]
MSDTTRATERAPDVEYAEMEAVRSSANGNGHVEATANGQGGGPASPPPHRRRRRPRVSDRTLAALGVAVGVSALISLGLGVGHGGHQHAAATPAGTALPAGHDHGAATATAPPSGAVQGRSAVEDGVRYEAYQRPDPTLPAVPAGPVKRFRVDVVMHETKVSDDQPPLRVWSFGVNGRFLPGTGASPPIVVNQGDRVSVTFVNGANAAMHVNMPHSLDIHAAELAPNLAFKTIRPGATWHYSFVAKDPGVFMYHCATEPMIWHLGSGMVGMFIVKPRNLPKVDRELWLIQQEYFLGKKPGDDADYTKMLAERPDVIAFNGYGHQYMQHPIHVRAGERIRMYILNPGPTHTSSFHVIGAIFDKTSNEGVTGGPAQVMALPPSTGGYVEFSLKQQGAFPFVDHNFASMAKGAMGLMVTEHAPRGAASGF